MYAETLQQIGLSPNEARIYEALLELGEATVSDLSTRTNIHRRNIYDAINRIVEKGLVTPIVGSKESKYAPVQPEKLLEIMEERKAKLETILPDMQKMFERKRGEEGVYILKGIEGYKNFLRDILSHAKSSYSIGAKDFWVDPRLKPAIQRFMEESRKLDIAFHILWDSAAKSQETLMKQEPNIRYKFLPSKYTSPGETHIYGNRVVIIPVGEKFEQIEDPITIFMIVSQKLADTYRKWFEFMWDNAKEIPETKKRG